MDPFLNNTLQNCQLRHTEADNGGWQYNSEQDSGAETGPEKMNKLDLDDGQHCLLPCLGSDTHLPAPGGHYLPQPSKEKIDLKNGINASVSK